MAGLFALPPHAPDKLFLSTDASTLQTTNQKNRFKKACVHHGNLLDQEVASPVKVLARCVCSIRSQKNIRIHCCAPFGIVKERDTPKIMIRGCTLL